MKVLVVGGHHTSSLVVAKLLKKKGVEVLWAGHVHSLSGDDSVSAEFKEVRKAGIEFRELVTGKYHRQSKLGFLNSLGLKSVGF